MNENYFTKYLNWHILILLLFYSADGLETIGIEQRSSYQFVDEAIIFCYKRCVFICMHQCL